jgi:hypothetical protein
MSIDSNYDTDSYRNDVDLEEEKPTVHVHYNSDIRIRTIVDMTC